MATECARKIVLYSVKTKIERFLLDLMQVINALGVDRQASARTTKFTPVEKESLTCICRRKLQVALDKRDDLGVSRLHQESAAEISQLRIVA